KPDQSRVQQLDLRRHGSHSLDGACHNKNPSSLSVDADLRIAPQATVREKRSVEFGRTVSFASLESGVIGKIKLPPRVRGPRSLPSTRGAFPWLANQPKRSAGIAVHNGSPWPARRLAWAR